MRLQTFLPKVYTAYMSVSLTPMYHVMHGFVCDHDRAILIYDVTVHLIETTEIANWASY